MLQCRQLHGLSWPGLFLFSLLHTIGWAVSAPFPPPSSSAAVDDSSDRVGEAAQRGGHACMHWLAPAGAISGGDGVEGMSDGSHSSQTPCKRQEITQGDYLMSAVRVKGILNDANIWLQQNCHGISCRHVCINIADLEYFAQELA